MPDLEPNAPPPRRRKSWLRRTLLAIGALILLLGIFHGVILRAVVHAVAVRVASAQHLQVQLQVEGGVLGGTTLRNVHAIATGPSALRSLDAALVRVDYSLTSLLFHGMSDFLQNVEVRDVTTVIDPAKAPSPKATSTPRPNEKETLPAIFPGRVEIANVSLTIRGQPQDLVIKNFSLGLYPDRPGELRVERIEVPAVHTWTNIAATTNYTGKNLFLRNLTLDQNNSLRVLNVDASRVASGKLGVQVQGSLGGGAIDGQAEIFTAGDSLGAKTHFEASGVSLGEMAAYFGHTPDEMAGAITHAQLDWQGIFERPVTWNGTIAAEVENFREEKIALDRARLSVTMGNGTANVREARADLGENHATVRGGINLPKTLRGFGQTPGNFQIVVDAPDLKRLTSFLPQTASGTLQASGSLTTGSGVVRLDLRANGNLLRFGDAATKQLSATISASKKIPATEKPRASIFAGLTTAVHAELTDSAFEDFAIDKVSADVKSEGAHVSLAALTVQRNNNLLVVRGTYQLPEPNEPPLKQPGDLSFRFRAPQLADFWKTEAKNKITGELQADGSVRLRGGMANGALNLSGAQIAASQLLVRQVSAQMAIAQNRVYLNDLTASLNERDYVRAHAIVAVEKPFRYTGAATVNLADLSAFEPLLATVGKKTPLAGSLVLNWNGDGDAANFKNKGDLDLKLERGRYADLQNLQATVEAHYTPNELNVPLIFLGSDKLDFQASLTAKGPTLEVSNFQIDEGAAKYASGYASLPFIWSNLGTAQRTFPPNGKVTLSFQSANLDIGKIFQDFGLKPPVSGQLNVKLDAQGPVDQLRSDLALQLQSVRASAAAQLEPASVDLGLHLANNQLTLDGKIQQAKIQPVQISGKVPLNLAQIIADKKIDEKTPLNLSVQMPRSSVNFVRQFVPALRELDGSLAINVGVNGTIAKPALSGTADMNVNVARFENATLPALTNFKALLNFRDNRLTIDRFGGDLAGGPFTLAGQITLPKLTEPNLDLRLKANDVLVARNDNVTARIDADIKMAGPFNSASVTGQVLTTNSRFLKDIDIIPIGLPGRPAPQPPSSAPVLSFPNPPLRDWKFDVAIKNKDPFLIRGNLATGEAHIDMKLGGTGLKPALQGQVRLTNFDATLPFSTLTIQYGFLYFDPDDPFNPRVELHGTSLIRDYTIHVYVYGTANAPQAVFNSEPPLPQEEIISLLATGVTREELTGNNNVLAGRAAILLVKQLYRKVFKHSDEEPKPDSFFNRLDVSFGAIDPRTGEQTATATYKVSEHYVLVGDLEVGGDFRGIVKYLIRFR